MEEEASGRSFSPHGLVVGEGDVPGGEGLIRRVHHRRSERDMETRTVRRRPDEEKWHRDSLKLVGGVPWRFSVSDPRPGLALQDI